MTRYINTFFRFLPILLIPVIVLPIITVGIGLTSKDSYQGTASIFVEQSLIDDQLDVVGGNYYLSPAQRNAALLRELLDTRSFITNVINRTRFKGALDSSDLSVREEAFEMMNSIGVDDSRYHIMGIVMTYKDPNVSKEILGATIEEYFAVLDERTKRQVGPALQVYEKREQDARKALNEIETELEKFLAANGQSLSIGNNPDNTNRPVSTVDLDYARIIQQRSTAQTQYEAARGEYNRVATSYNAYRDNRENLFRIQDAPQEEVISVARGRIFLINGAIGIVGGLLLMLLGVLFITWLDSSFRERASVVRMLGVPNISVQDVMAIRSKVGGKRKGSFDLRRSVIEQIGWSDSTAQLESPKPKKVKSGT
jgi:uncharacterized protein involved in exopolysaccharide biosynthesis